MFSDPPEGERRLEFLHLVAGKRGAENRHKSHIWLARDTVMVEGSLSFSQSPSRLGMLKLGLLSDPPRQLLKDTEAQAQP